jgi:hypothetical protein
LFRCWRLVERFVLAVLRRIETLRRFVKGVRMWQNSGALLFRPSVIHRKMMRCSLSTITRFVSYPRCVDWVKNGEDFFLFFFFFFECTNAFVVFRWVSFCFVVDEGGSLDWRAKTSFFARYWPVCQHDCWTCARGLRRGFFCFVFCSWAANDSKLVFKTLLTIYISFGSAALVS